MFIALHLFVVTTRSYNSTNNGVYMITKAKFTQATELTITQSTT